MIGSPDRRAEPASIAAWIDLVIMRCVDSVMAFPAFILAMAITAALGNSVTNVLLAIALTQIPTYLRLVRGEILRIREMEYADAARVVGNPAVAHHVHPPAAQRAAADHRAGDAGHGLCAADHGGAVLHRPRHPAAAERMGRR